ncbi:flippase [Desulfonema ishimotonii]|uniref:Flippase n=1 Tax=Desulfonema ishimotonii TaxID=45657 RepID=A0A401G3D2_9BACT|nr:oligosaccharide flippase family protein [Desulfonema ishimotonii]GBC63752.1 flippase [Desulfonema ishimotonii]
MKPKYQILHNAIFNTLSWVFSIVINFAFLPYIVHKLGAEAYGVLVLILSIIGYFAIMDLNLGQAIIKYVAEYNGKNKKKKVNEIIRVTIFLYLILGLAGSLIIFSLSHIIVDQFLKIRPEMLPDAHFATSIGAAGFLFTMLLSALSAILKGLNRYDITSKITIIMNIINTISSVILLYAGFGLRELIMLNVSISLFSMIIYIIIGKRLLPGLKLTPAFNLFAFKKVFNFAIFSSLSRISEVFKFQGERLLVGAALGVSGVTYYVVPSSLVRKVMTFTSHLGSVILPVVSNLQGKEDYDAVIALYLKSSKLIAVIATSTCLPLILFGNQLLGLWMGIEFQEKTGMVMLLLTLSFYMDAFTNVPAIVVNGLGRPKITGLFALANAIINLTLIYPLAKIMGINGIAIAFFVSNIGIAPVFIFYANNKVLGFPLSALIKKAYLLPIVSAFLTAMLLLFFCRYEIRNFFELLCIMITTTILYIVISSIIGVFSSEEKSQCIDYLRSILGGTIQRFSIKGLGKK